MAINQKAVVVTGASTGIGLAISKVLVEEGFAVFGSVRKPTDAERLQSELGANFTPLLMDVTDAEAVNKAAETVRSAIGQNILAGLVNNAGIAVTGPLIYLPLEDFRKQLEVNLVAPFVVTQAFAPLLGAEKGRVGKPGRIVNISSVSGKFGPPFMGAYAASKHGLEGMSESLRRELLIYGIDVVVIGPGWVKTPILDKAEAEDYSQYQATDYGPILDKYAKAMFASGRKGLEASAIGEATYTALTTPIPKTRYAMVQNKFSSWILRRVLPARFIDKKIAKNFEKLRNAD